MHTAVSTDERRGSFAETAPDHSRHGVFLARRQMIVKTLRARIALWTVAVVSGALILFGGGAAWNLRKELVKNLDIELEVDGRNLLSEIKEQPVDWSGHKGGEAFLKEESNPVGCVELEDRAGRVLYRSANLHNQEVFRFQNGNRPYEFSSDGRRLRFRVFETGRIRWALG